MTTPTPTPTAAEHRDMLDFRAMVEIDAVRSIAMHDGDTAGVRAGIDDALRRQREAIAMADPLEFASADYAFHAEVIRGGGNSVVAGILDMLAPRVARFTYLAITQPPSRITELLDEHSRLGALALAGESQLYGDLVHEHISRGHSAVVVPI